jgi:hypothetical protein
MSVLGDLGFAAERGVPILGKPTLDADFCRDNHGGRKLSAAGLVGLGGFILGQFVGGQVAGYFCLGLGAVARAAVEAWAKAAAKEIRSIFTR